MFRKAFLSGLVPLVRSFHSAKLIRDHNRFGIIGVPFAKGQRRAGVDLGPSAIRAGGLIGHLKEIAGIFEGEFQLISKSTERGFLLLDYVDVRDYGDVEYTPKNEVIAMQNMLELNAVSECNYELSRKVHRILSDGRMVITLGGDHAIGIGSVDGHYRYNPNVAVIWVDAHADLNTNATSQSGNIHGMPVALLAKELTDYWPYLPGMDWQKPNIPINNFGYIGLRSVDDFERAIIEKYEIAAYGMREIDHLGIVKVVQNVLQRIDPENKKSIHLSFDIDALDSLEAPSTGTSGKLNCVAF